MAHLWIPKLTSYHGAGRALCARTQERRVARERRQREKAREAEKRKRQVLASLEPLPTTISAEEALAGMRTTHMSGVDALIAAIRTED